MGWWIGHGGQVYGSQKECDVTCIRVLHKRIRTRTHTFHITRYKGHLVRFLDRFNWLVLLLPQLVTNARNMLKSLEELNSRSSCSNEKETHWSQWISTEITNNNIVTVSCLWYSLLAIVWLTSMRWIPIFLQGKIWFGNLTIILAVIDSIHFA